MKANVKTIYSYRIRKFLDH